MEFQSYTLYYTNEIQKNEILQTIKQNNEYVKENNMEHGELFRILNAKLKTKPFYMPIKDSRYCTFILGNEPIGIIMCCNIGCSSFTFNYFKHLVCTEYKEIHRRYYLQDDVEVVNINNINCSTHDNLNK